MATINDRADTWPILQWVLGHLVDTTRRAIRLQNRAAAMRKLTMTDELTGLYNRRGFLTMARQQLRLASRDGRCMSLFVVDVDRLKAINDSFGHSAGDEVLRRVAAVLGSTFRQSDIVARHGGDEFVVLALDAAQTNQRAIAARFEHGVELHNRRSGVMRISMSIGAVRFDPRGTRRLEDLIRRADSRMYSHKQARRGNGVSWAG
jgi:diguanylate cyclase (GGDEF)-like protein